MFGEFFIHRPKFAFVISIVISIAGLIAIKSLPVAQYPDITPPVVTISTSYPGANAETAEKVVVTPIEAQVNGVKNMLYMSSQSSNDGTVAISVSFDIGSNPDLNTVNTKNREDSAEPLLPEEVKRQGVKVEEQSTNMLCIVDLHSKDKEIDELYLSNYMLINIQDAIARIPGVGKVAMFGKKIFAMRIWIDPDRLSSMGISTQDIIKSIQEQNVQSPVGQIGSAPIRDEQQFTYTIQTEGRLADVEDFKNIIIQAAPNGAFVRLGDVARVELGPLSYAVSSELNGRPAALLAVYQLPSANGLEVVRKIREEMNRLAKNFPEHLEYGTVYDTTKFIRASVIEVVKTLFIAVFLVILITYIFLQDWRATLIPAIAIPVSLIGTFAVLLMLNYSINLITLFGLILAIGIVVDDAITVIESVKHKMDIDGLNPLDATKSTMKLVTGPVIATTLVLLAVFVPVMFLPGMTGVLYRQFAVTIAVSVSISSINALSLSPALAATFMKPGFSPPAIFKPFNYFFDKLTSGYMGWVRFFSRKLILTGLGFVLLIAVSSYLYKILPTGFIPEEDNGYFMIGIQLPEGAAVGRTARVVERVKTICATENSISDILAVTGFNFIDGMPEPNAALIVAVLKPWNERGNDPQNTIVQRVQGKLSAIPEANIFAFGTPSIPGLGTTGGFEFVLQDRRNASAQDFATTLSSMIMEANKQPELLNIYSSYQADVPQIYLDVDRDKVKKLGIDLVTVFNTLQTNLGSAYINDFNKFGKTFQVMVQADEKFRYDITKLNAIYVRADNGSMVPLSTLIKHKYILGPEVIEHYNLYRSTTIRGSASPGYSSGQAIKAMERVAATSLPEGYGYEWTGMSYQELLAGNKALMVFMMGLVFIYLFLVAQYESWMIPFAVMFSVPIAFFGALSALWILGLENNIYTQVGFVLLFGLASKTAILIVEYAKKQHENGAGILESAEAAASLRFRAVLMTAVSFVLGVFPLVVASGPGAVSRRVLGTAVFGGMLFSAIFATILVPAFYVIIQKLIELKGKKQLNK